MIGSLLSDVEIEKLERRKARYQERSPSPIMTSSQTSLSQMQIPLPSLPLPSVSPTVSSIPCSKSKGLFMNGLGLNSVTLEQKRGNYNFIIKVIIKW